MQRHYYVYILASRSRNLYIGVTVDLHKRVAQHRVSSVGFVAKYRITRLVFIEEYQHVGDALRREKQLKGWLRKRKVALIEQQNPGWLDYMAQG